MNDLDILRDSWGETAPPDDRARDAARAALLERAAGPAPARRRRWPRFAVRLAAVGALAGAVAVGVTVVQTSGGTDEDGRPRSVLPGIPPGPVANAAQALERAALAAEARPFTPPRPDQWIYMRELVRTGATPNGPRGTKDIVRQTWQRADGRQGASLEGGKIVTHRKLPTTPPSDYVSLAALPTDPDALLRWVYRQMAGPGDRKDARGEIAYSMFGAILRDNVLPPRSEAAIFRTLKQVPGVRLEHGVTSAAGRPAIRLSRLTEGYLREEMLLDAKTFAYLGERAVAIRNHTSRGDDVSLSFRKGDLARLIVRQRTGIVDRPGQLP